METNKDDSQMSLRSIPNEIKKEEEWGMSKTLQMKIE